MAAGLDPLTIFAGLPWPTNTMDVGPWSLCYFLPEAPPGSIFPKGTWCGEWKADCILVSLIPEVGALVQ